MKNNRANTTPLVETQAAVVQVAYIRRQKIYHKK